MMHCCFRLLLLTLCCGWLAASDRRHKVPMPGVTVGVTDHALSYFSTLARRAMPELLEGVVLQDVGGSGWGLRGMTIKKIEKPHINTRFLANKGIRSTMMVSHLAIEGKYHAGYGWLKTQGDLTVDLYDFVVETTLQISLEHQEPRVHIEGCKAELGDSDIVFRGSWSSFLMNSISTHIEDFLRDEIDGLLCETAHQKAREYEQELGGVSGRRPKRETGAEAAPSAFSMNLSLSQPPMFRNSSAAFALNGTMLYHGEAAQLNNVTTGPTPTVARGRMLTIIVSELVPNSFFSHVHSNGLAQIDKSFQVNDLPSSLRGTLGILCPYCAARFQGGLNAPPMVHVRGGDNIDGKGGVKLDIHGWVKTTVHAFWRQMELFMVQAKLKALLKPYVNNDKLVADTEVGKIELDVNDVDLGSVLTFFREEIVDALNAFIPEQVGPSLESEFRRVFGEAGITLPAVYGIKLRNPQLRYVDHGVVIETDLEYDATEGVRHLKQAVKETMAKRAKRRR